MLYLEDYIELIEHLPGEIRENLTHIRELDLAVDTNEHLLEKQITNFFAECSKYENEIPASLKNEYEYIQNMYKSFLDNSDEKISIANHMYEIVEKYLKRLENELFKFKLELEADNKGITEQLEKRSLQLDDHIFHSSPTTSFTRNHYNNSFNYNSVSSQPSQSLYFQQYQHPQHIDHQSSPQQHQRDKENRQKRIERRKDNERNASISSISNYNPVAVTSVNSNSPVASNVTKIVSSIPQNSIGYNLGQTGAGTAIAVAASQAIAATQQLQQGRRTASLKASYEAINNSSRELSVAKELQGAAHTALQAIQQDQMSNKRNKKKWIGNLQSLSQQQQLSVSASASILGRSSPNISMQTSQTQMLSVSNSSSQAADTYVDNVVTDSTEVGLDNKWLSDPNEPRYCICNQVSYGDMVACDNPECPFEWFHYACVGVSAPPKGRWYCPQCSTSRKKSRKN